MSIFKKLFKKDKERFKIPKSVQQAIPIETAYTDGVFQVGKKRYSKTYRFTDINYSVASDEDKRDMFLDYSAFLNSFDDEATTKITINNRVVNKTDLERGLLIPYRQDNLDGYRREYNEMLMDKAASADSIVQEKYITVTVEKNDIEEAKAYFSRIETDFTARLKKLDSKLIDLSANDRLHILHDFYRNGEDEAFDFDLKQTDRKGHDFKDSICPDSFEFKRDYFRIGDKYGRVIFLSDYASGISDKFVSKLTSLNRNLMLSIDISPVPAHEAVKNVEKTLLGVNTEITNWKRKQTSNGNYGADVPYDMAARKEKVEDLLNDINDRDQRMFMCVLTMVITADSMEQLNIDTKQVMMTAQSENCQMGKLTFQQYEGLRTVLPIGSCEIECKRTLTSESLAVLMPFRVQDIRHNNGIYYGINPISKNLILINRAELLNGNGFILGVPGGGKSFTAKGEIVEQMLAGKADIIIIDPEREYSPLVRAMNGEVIPISATSPYHINALDINKDYDESANPITLKSQFIMSLCQQIMGNLDTNPKHQSIIDSCARKIYREYINNGYKGTPPTLVDFRNELIKRTEPEAKDLALALELFTEGSLNTFAQNTNVDTDNRLICYDILDLGKQLMPIGMLVILDSILNRITANRAKGKKTYIFIDEIYLLFEYEYSANFLFTLWKRVRKYGAYATGITQNVEDLLQSHTARSMLANSELIVMLNQASTDRVELAKLLNISEEEMKYITNVDAGHGLLKIGSSLVPFENKFPHNSLYKLMSTKPGEA